MNIYQNPLKACLVKYMTQYKYSSYIEYIGNDGLVEKEIIFNLFNENKDKALIAFIKYNNN
jgi:putative transposase